MAKKEKIYKNPRRKPVGETLVVPVEHRPKTLQETLQEMVARELRFRDLAVRTGAGGADSLGLDDVDLLGDDDDTAYVGITPSEREFLLAELETAARVREKVLKQKQITGRVPGDQKTLPAQNPQPAPTKEGEAGQPTKKES